MSISAKEYKAGDSIKNINGMGTPKTGVTSFIKNKDNFKKRSKLKSMVKAPDVGVRPNSSNPGNRAPGSRLPHSRRGALD